MGVFHILRYAKEQSPGVPQVTQDEVLEIIIGGELIIGDRVPVLVVASN